MAIALAKCRRSSVHLKLNSLVTPLRKNGLLPASMRNGKIKARYVVNAAGLFSDQIHKWSGHSYRLSPIEVILAMIKCRTVVNHIICARPPIPKGGDLANCINELGPMRRSGLKKPLKQQPTALNLSTRGGKITDRIPFDRVITSFAGKAKTQSGDFIIGESEAARVSLMCGDRCPGWRVMAIALRGGTIGRLRSIGKIGF